jgi:crotonobetainyl-CoA:carnitine CoA-transferase CaiB-like acyl-CoA transferase
MTTATLQGLTVIDAASFLAGPCAATILSDYGADVIKIEPLSGDGQRRLSGTYPVDYTWQLTSRNKRSLALDFTTPPGRDVLLRLIGDADVLLVNLRTDQLARYGLTYETLRPLNPRLIYAQISGYGLEGAEASRRAFDLTGWFARTGILDVMHDKDTRPAPPAGGVGDHATAMTLFGAIMLALYRREQTGAGGMVSTSLAATGTWANGLHVQGVLAGNDSTQRRDAEGWSNPFSNVYTTADRRYVMLALATPRQEWPRLARALGHPEWADDVRFAEPRAALKNRHALRALLADGFAAMTAAAIDTALKDEDVTFSLVARLADVVNDPQLHANGLIVATASAEPGYERTLATPFKLHDEPQRVPTRAPALGEHSRAILARAGYDDAAIAALVEQGVVGEARC